MAPDIRFHPVRLISNESRGTTQIYDPSHQLFCVRRQQPQPFYVQQQHGHCLRQKIEPLALPHVHEMDIPKVNLQLT